MSEIKPPDISGSSREQKRDLLKRPIKKNSLSCNTKDETALSDVFLEELPKSFYQFGHFREYEQLRRQHLIWQKAGVQNPFFKLHDRMARDTTSVDGRELINFSTYSYLGLNGDIRVSNAAAEAAKRFGTSASASRLVSGERPPHRELERGLADFLHAEDCVTFVSGHTTNVSTLSAVLGPDRKSVV